MLRTLVAMFAVACCGSALAANLSPAQRVKVRDFVAKDVATNSVHIAAINGQTAIKDAKIRVRITATKGATATVRGEVDTKNLSWPFPRTDGSFEGRRQFAIRKYTATPLAGDNVTVTPVGDFAMGSEQVVK